MSDEISDDALVAAVRHKHEQIKTPHEIHRLIDKYSLPLKKAAHPGKRDVLDIPASERPAFLQELNKL
jgi:hypothetical protein